VTLREGLDIVRTMSIEKVNESAQPVSDDIMFMPHKPGTPRPLPSLVRLLARMRRDDPDGFHELLIAMDPVRFPIHVVKGKRVFREPEQIVDVGERDWSLAAEMVRREFVRFAWPGDVANQLQHSRVGIHDHVRAFQKTHVVEKRKVGRRTEYRIGPLKSKSQVAA